MTTDILLVRHGQTESNITGYYMGWSEEDLDDTGLAQVRSLSARLSRLPIAAIYTSPLRRTYTTATIIAEPHRLPLIVMDDLIEIKLGDWQGLHMNEIKREWPELWRQSRVDPSVVTMPNGESFSQVGERAVRAFNAAAAANEGKQVVIVTHDAVVRMIAAHVIGAPSSIYRKIEIANASLSILRINNANARLITLNDTAHLAC